MTNKQKKQVEEWVIAINLATDDKSPFKGLVDLSTIFKEPLEVQHAIFNQLSDKTKENLQALYGEKET